MEQRLNGRVAFVTGGTSGIGLAIAQLFIRHGARVVVTGRDEAALAHAATLLGPQALALRADVTQIAELDRAFAQAAALGPLDVLVANAGIGRFAPLEATTEAVYDEVMATNAKGVYFTVQRALPYLSPRAAVVLCSSFVALTGLPNTSVLSASKAAVTSLGKTLAAELAPRGIRVNTLSPGYIATPFAGKAGLPPEALAGLGQNALAATPLGRLGTAEEIARAALFLVSDDASYLIGSDLLVDGGVVHA